MKTFDIEIASKRIEIAKLVLEINEQAVFFGPSAELEVRRSPVLNGDTIIVIIKRQGEDDVRYSTFTKQSQYQSNCQILNYLDQIIDELQGALRVES